MNGCIVSCPKDNSSWGVAIDRSFKFDCLAEVKCREKLVGIEHKAQELHGRSVSELSHFIDNFFTNYKLRKYAQSDDKSLIANICIEISGNCYAW
jgi:hypothetical protein